MPFFVQGRDLKEQTSLTQIVACEGPPHVSLTGVGAIQRVSIVAGETGEIVRVDHHVTFHRQGVTELRSVHEGGSPGLIVSHRAQYTFGPQARPTPQVGTRPLN